MNAIVTKLGEIQRISRVIFLSLQAKIGGKLSFNGQQLFVILSGHQNVKVVIPGDESLMPYGSKQCPIGNDVLDLVFCHESVEIFKSSCQIFVYQG